MQTLECDSDYLVCCGSLLAGELSKFLQTAAFIIPGIPCQDLHRDEKMKLTIVITTLPLLCAMSQIQDIQLAFDGPVGNTGLQI